MPYSRVSLTQNNNEIIYSITYAYMACYIVIRAGVKYVFVFANTNTNTAYLYLYLYLIKFQTMYLYLYLYLYLICRIWCIWQIRFQIHFFPGPFSTHRFMEHKLTWIFLVNMLKSVILFQNKCKDLTLLIPIGDCACALGLACQWVCFAKPLEQLNVEWSLHILLNVMMCPRIEYIYANIIDISIFIINLWYDILCQHECDGQPCSCYPYDSTVCSQHGVSGLPSEYPLISRCKGTLNTCPTSWFVARYFKESSVPYGFV